MTYSMSIPENSLIVEDRTGQDANRFTVQRAECAKALGSRRYWIVEHQGFGAGKLCLRSRFLSACAFASVWVASCCGTINR